MEIVRNWSKYISQLPPGMTRVSLMQAKHSVGASGSTTQIDGRAVLEGV